MYTTYITTTTNRSIPQHVYVQHDIKTNIPDHHISPHYIKTTKTIPEYHHQKIGKKSLGAAVAQFGSCKVSTKNVTYHVLLLSWLDFDDSAKGPILLPTQLASTDSVA
jgi:hypothetical protein